MATSRVAVVDGDRVVVEVELDAVTALAAYEAVSDVERMSDWSPEGRGVRRGPGALRVGDEFSGRNRNGWHRWSTSCRVVVAAPGAEFAFDVSSLGLAVARWSYALESTPAGVIIRETWTDRRGWFMKLAGTLATGVGDRAQHNASTMRVTLDALAASLEPSGR